MSRLIFTVAPSAPGWQLSEGNDRRCSFPCRQEALAVAALMASTLHSHHGLATGVVIDLAGAEPVLVSVHG